MMSIGLCAEKWSWGCEMKNKPLAEMIPEKQET